MRIKLPMHGRSHRLGGSDPVPIELPYCYGKAPSGVVTVTAGAVYLGLDNVFTSDRRTFAHMPLTTAQGNVNSISDGSVVLLKRGIYRVITDVTTDPSGPIGTSDTIEQFLAVSSPGAGFFTLMETLGSHHGWQGKRIVTGQTTALKYWNIVDLVVGSGSFFAPVALKPYFNSSDTSYALASWSISVTRIGNPRMSNISDVGLPTGVILS